MERMRGEEKRKRQRLESERNKGNQRRLDEQYDQMFGPNGTDYQETAAMMEATTLATEHGVDLLAQLRAAEALMERGAADHDAEVLQACARAAADDRKRIEEAVMHLHETARVCVEHTAHVLQRQACVDGRVETQPLLRYLVGMPSDVNDAVNKEKRLTQFYGAAVLPGTQDRFVFARPAANSRTLRDPSAYEHCIHVSNSLRGQLPHTAPLKCIQCFGKRMPHSGPRRRAGE